MNDYPYKTDPDLDAPQQMARLIAEVERLKKELDDCRQFLQIEPAQNVAEYLKLAIPNLERERNNYRESVKNLLSARRTRDEQLNAWRSCAENLAEALRYVTFERMYAEPKIAKANAALARLKELARETALPVWQRVGSFDQAVDSVLAALQQAADEGRKEIDQRRTQNTRIINEALYYRELMRFAGIEFCKKCSWPIWPGKEHICGGKTVFGDVFGHRTDDSANTLRAERDQLRRELDEARKKLNYIRGIGLSFGECPPAPPPERKE